MDESSGLDEFTFENHATLPIAIVGGGLCGLALAIGLVKHGINVRIFEAAQAFSEIGAGVSFGINSITALELLDPRLLQGYKKHATFNADRTRDDVFYTMRWGVDERREGGHKAGDFGWHLRNTWDYARTEKAGVRTRSCIHRARLLDELVDFLPPDITTFGKSFESAEEQTDGTISICFTDGTSTLASALLGCDGIKSKVRAFVCPPHVQPVYARECAYRAVVPRAAAIKCLGADLALNGHIYCGYGAYIITYPIDHSELINMVAIAYDKDHEKWEQVDWTVPVTTEEIKQRFAGWFQPLMELIAKHHLSTKWALFALPHSSPYYKNKICLVGDAAHATVPHLGAGAGMAMEDAYVLSSLIAAAGSVAHIHKVFKAYDDVRRSRSQECVRRSLKAAIDYDFMGKGVGDDVDKLRMEFEDSFRWLWGADLVAVVERQNFLIKNENKEW
ncbi:hypothetical protein ACEQ8H_007051 [Pleosporales sp. CAS-2024a]